MAFGLPLKGKAHCPLSPSHPATDVQRFDNVTPFQLLSLVPSVLPPSLFCLFVVAFATARLSEGYNPWSDQTTRAPLPCCRASAMLPRIYVYHFGCHACDPLIQATRDV